MFLLELALSSESGSLLLTFPDKPQEFKIFNTQLLLARSIKTKLKVDLPSDLFLRGIAGFELVPTLDLVVVAAKDIWCDIDVAKEGLLICTVVDVDLDI